MGDRTSEASPARLDRLTSPPVPVEVGRSRWSQGVLFGATHIVIKCQHVIDGPAGQLVSSVGAQEFWTGDRLALEVRTGLRFPTDLPQALTWADHLAETWAAGVEPF